MATQEEIAKAAALIRAGQLVVFPTETVYGLGGNALDPKAIRKIYELKGRPASSPLIVHVAGIDQARALAVEWPESAEQLAREHWPGPLTLVVLKKSFIPDEVTAGLPTVGIRVPRHPVALALLKAAVVPVAAPSANRFTQLSPTAAQHVREAFGEETPYLLDGGPSEVGIESTVIAVSSTGLEVLRPGMAHVRGADAAGPTSAEIGDRAHRSPGQHQKHYSPRTRVLLLREGALPPTGRGALLLLKSRSSAKLVRQMPDNPTEYAAQIYATLHELDRQHLDWIAIEVPPVTPEWAAVRDRLLRAAYSPEVK